MTQNREVNCEVLHSAGTEDFCAACRFPWSRRWHGVRHPQHFTVPVAQRGLEVDNVRLNSRHSCCFFASHAVTALGTTGPFEPRSSPL